MTDVIGYILLGASAAIPLLLRWHWGVCFPTGCDVRPDPRVVPVRAWNLVRGILASGCFVLVISHLFLYGPRVVGTFTVLTLLLLGSYLVAASFGPNNLAVSMLHILLPCAFVVVVGYWALVAPRDMRRSRWTTYIGHGANAAVAYIDFWVSRAHLDARYCAIVGSAWCALFVPLALLVYVCTGHWPYPFMDESNPLLPLAVLGLDVAVALGVCVAYGLAQLKKHRRAKKE